MSGKEWICWVRVHAGGVPTSKVVVDYVVRLPEDPKGKRKCRFGVFLPTFSLPLGRLEVLVEHDSGSSGSLVELFPGSLMI